MEHACQHGPAEEEALNTGARAQLKKYPAARVETELQALLGELLHGQIYALQWKQPGGKSSYWGAPPQFQGTRHSSRHSPSGAAPHHGREGREGWLWGQAVPGELQSLSWRGRRGSQEQGVGHRCAGSSAGHPHGDEVDTVCYWKHLPSRANLCGCNLVAREPAFRGRMSNLCPALPGRSCSQTTARCAGGQTPLPAAGVSGGLGTWLSQHAVPLRSTCGFLLASPGGSLLRHNTPGVQPSPFVPTQLPPCLGLMPQCCKAAFCVGESISDLCDISALPHPRGVALMG